MNGPDIAPTAPKASSHVRAGGGDRAGGEGGRVHAVLGRRRRVGVNRLHVLGIGVAAPADHEPLDDIVASFTRICGTVGSPGPRADWATNESVMTDARARSSRAWSSLMSSSWSHAPGRGEHVERTLHVHPDIAGVHGIGYGRRAAARGRTSCPEQAQDVPEGHGRRGPRCRRPGTGAPAFPVGLGDLDVERHDTFESGLEVGHSVHVPRVSISAGTGSGAPARGAATAEPL